MALLSSVWLPVSTSITKHLRVIHKGSRFKKAEPWVNGVAGPAMPTQMMSNVEVFDS